MIPPVPDDLDLRDFQYMPLDVVRLVDSDLTALSTGDEFKAAVILWCKAWHQVPASSLPDDDRMLAHLAGYGRDIREWKKVREVALRKFVKCDDGRLYHPTIASKALEASEAKRKQRERTSAATNARQAKSAKRDDDRNEPRDAQHDAQHDVQRNENRNVHQGKRREEKGRERGEVVARARDPDLDLERKLREAAGWQNEPSPSLAITGSIQALVDNGADLELDVLPTIRAIASKADGRSWNYFVKAIARQRDKRIEASTIVSEPTRTGHERSQPARQSTVDTVLGLVRGGNGQGDPDVR
jgi:hypothetical protein